LLKHEAGRGGWPGHGDCVGGGATDRERRRARWGWNAEQVGRSDALVPWGPDDHALVAKRRQAEAEKAALRRIVDRREQGTVEAEHIGRA